MDREIYSLCLRAGELALGKQEKDGSMPAGVNGPHNHNMTVARNTGHFSILFSFLFKITGQEKWKNAAYKCLDKLLQLRPLEGSFWHRKEDLKSSYNGLIGQAWTLEALIYASKTFHNEVFLAEAKNLVECHSFDKNVGLWHELSLDGSKRKINTTLNQQIWFMAMAHKTNPNDKKMREYSKIFLNKLYTHCAIRRTGLFYSQIFGIPREFGKFKDIILKARSRKRRLIIDYGYHVFTLLGLAFLYRSFRNNNFFRTKLFLKALALPFTDLYKTEILKSPYGYGYNVPGFELPYIYSIFNDLLTENVKDNMMYIYEYQINNHFSKITDGLLASDTLDTETLAARIYEICRLHSEWEF